MEIQIRNFILLVCVLSLIGSQVSTAADEEEVHPYLDKKFALDFGVFFPDRHLDIRVNGSLGGENAAIDFDERRRVRRADNVFSAEFSWRMNDQWMLVGQYFTSEDNGRAVLEEDIEWEDVVFDAGSYAAVGSSFTLTRVFFGRQFGNSRNHNFGFGAGIHWLDLGAFIEGEILINGTPTVARESVSVDTPLPNIGAWYMYSISPRWALATRLDLLSADVGELDGLLINFAVGVNYRAFENFGVGLNYNYFKLDVGIDKSFWHGDVETIYDGVYLHASFYF